jgi:alanine racemase
VPHPFRSYALVSRDRLVHNYRELRRAVGPSVEVVAVVKADAYGHGAAEVSRVLVGAGAGWLAVSSVDEGIALRQEGLAQPRILVMGGFLPYEAEALAEHDLTPAIHSLDQVAAVEDAARRAGRPLRYHLKLDTGMHRLGAPPQAQEILAAQSGAPHACLEGLMTHFASSSDYSSPQTAEQLECFERVKAALAQGGCAPAFVHASGSNAIGYARREGWHNMVRAGLALYGYLSPAEGDAPAPLIDVRPALAWKAKLLLVKDIPEGALIGYGGSFRAPRAMRIGIVGAGYADGVFHRLSNRGHLIAAGKPAPILGTVSMDVTTIDLTQAPHLAAGDEVTLLGEEGGTALDAQQIAETAGTISYSVLCNISKRVRRVYC